MAKFLYGQLIQSRLAKNLNINNTPGIDINTDPLLTEQYIRNNFRTFCTFCTECGHFTALSALSAADKSGCSQKFNCTIGRERKSPMKL